MIFLLASLVYYMVNSDEQGRQDALKDVFFAQLVYWVAVFSVYQSVIIFIGFLVNQTMTKHR